MAPSAGEFFCGFTVAAFDGTFTREAARSSDRKAAAWPAAVARWVARSPSSSSQGARAFMAGKMGLFTVRSSCRAKVTMPSYPA